MGNPKKPTIEPLKLSQPFSFADLTAYQSDAIVSRTLIDKPQGTITIFSFDAGQGLSEHTAPFDAVVQVLDGQAELTIGGEPMTATAGQAVLMPANVPHAVKATARFKMLLTMLRAKP